MNNTVIGEDGNLYDTWTSGSSAGDKSINASQRLETSKTQYYYGGLAHVLSGIWDIAAFNLDFWSNTAPASGINPTHSLETTIL
jgi:hypothetical protein